ncbi:MAG TPA: hypothetical protein GX687_04935 [Clostridia bacterium]|nr:hypothetical protein [Clostridia bacterium]
MLILEEKYQHLDHGSGLKELVIWGEKFRGEEKRPLSSWKHFGFDINSDEERNFQVELTEKRAR